MAASKHPRLTKEQSAALTTQDRSISLSAGAGCGKTFVLTERFLSHLDPKVHVPTAELSELVAITFTEAAAREMRDRIRRRCLQRLGEAEDATDKQFWQKLIHDLQDAQISTIHSFCTSVLRRFAPEAEVDPRFEVLDSASAELLRLQTLDDSLRQLLIQRNERVIRLATHFELRNLRNHISELLGKSTAAFYAQWGKATTLQVVDTWKEYYRTVHIPALREDFLASSAVMQLRAICSSASVLKPALGEHLSELANAIDQFPETEDTTVSILDLRSLAMTQGVCKKKDWDNEEDFALYRDTCKAVRNLIDKGPLTEILDEEQLEVAAEMGLELMRLVMDIRNDFEQIKRERHALEFDDLLSRTHQLLTAKELDHVRKSLSKSIQLLMVDEFQDTDPLQVAIVEALCGEQSIEEGLFVVGDFKQSIYRFRGAEPRVSNQLRASLPPESRLSLTVNFRSQPAILDFVNALFCDSFGKEYEPLKPYRQQQTPTPSIELLWADGRPDKSDDEFPEDYSPAQLARAREAHFIARRLAQLIDTGEPVVVDPKSQQPRALQLGDIAILLRSLSDVNIYETALREYGLDYYLSGGHAFYTQQEIYDILHLLRAINSPADELSLAGALRSPFFSLEDELLYWLVESHGSLNEGLRLQNSIPQISAEQLGKIQRAAETIQHFRAVKDRSLVAELLTQVIARTGYDAILMCDFLGERKLANVEKLIDQARSHDRTSPGDLDGFITQLSEFVLRAPKEALAASNSEGDVIRMMTIHHAKGLEFPLVVVPDLNRRSPNFSRSPVFDEHLGPLVPPEHEEKGKKYCVGWTMYRHSERQEELAERIRVLYVACTRASDYLMLSSSFKDLEKDLQSPRTDWLKFLNERFDLATGECRVDLPPTYEAPKILVTKECPETQRQAASASRGVDLNKLVEKTLEDKQSRKGNAPASVERIPVDYAARRQFSFSRLSGQLQKGDTNRDRGEELLREDNPLDARGLGTLVHAVFEHIDFQGDNDVLGLCEHLAPLHVETKWEEASSCAAEMINGFLKSDRAAALAKAPVVRREVEFLMPWTRQGKPYEGHFLQGYIDCLYQDEQGTWHIVDYKTNHTTVQGVPELAANYRLQMFVYSLACERALNVTPSESALCFLRPGQEHVFVRDEKTDLQFISMLDGAIEALLTGA